MFKNVAAKFVVYAFDSTTGLPKTGDAANITAYVSKDYGTVTVLGDTSATEMDSTNAKGYYLFDAAQAETNADCLMVSAKSSTANIVVVGAPAVIYTRPTTGWLAPTVAGRTLDVSSGGEAGVDWANVGSPTTTVDLSGTTVAVTQKVDVNTIKTQAVTCAAGVTVLASVGTAATSTAQTGDNYARLGAPVGASISADVAAVKAVLPAALVSGRIDASVGAMATGVLTATAIASDAITDAKVAADVTIASVTGAVGSVTGNVGGNVTGSVGSVSAAVTVTGDLSATMKASVNAEVDTAISDAALATAANLATVAGYLDTEIAAILADTNELQTDWADGGRLDLILDARASQTSVDDVPTNAELTTALGDIPTATENADALLNRDMAAVSVTNSRSPINALRFIRNGFSIAGSTLTVLEEDDSTPAYTRALTTDASADPITGVS